MDFLPSARPPRLALAAAAFAGWALAGPAAAEVKVVASIKPVHSLVGAVMAGVGEPHLLMRGRASPHTFTLRPSDAAALAGADVVFLIDEMMETTLAASIGSLAGKSRVVALADAEGLIRKKLRKGGAFDADLDHDHDRDRGHGHAAFDMHIWLDPANAWTMARTIADTLAQADPANAARYRANARALLPRLDAVTAEISAELAPARGRPFIVFHDGYRYFEDRFGLNAVGSAVVSPERSPGVKRLRELRARVRELGVVCVFDEPQFDRRIVEVIVEGSEVRSGTVDPLGADIDDGPELYFTLLRNMGKAFRTCLSPEG